ILDEAQNTTSEQMKMFLTRLGFGSKAVVTGDITQFDLPVGRTSGLVEAMTVVSKIEGISFVFFDDRDVVRHKLVQQIVKAYESFTSGNSRRPAEAPRGGQGSVSTVGVASAPADGNGGRLGAKTGHGEAEPRRS